MDLEDSVPGLEGKMTGGHLYFHHPNPVAQPYHTPINTWNLIFQTQDSDSITKAMCRVGS